MRIRFSTLDRPKKAARIMASILGCPLSQAQEAVAALSGYRDWHDLSAGPDRKGGSVDKLDEQHDLVALQVELASKLCELLESTSVDALYALAASHLVPSRSLTTLEQLDAQVRLWSQRELPKRGPRLSGAIGRVGRTGQAILRNYGRPTRYISHKSADATCTDFEYITPRKTVGLFVPMRLYVPYGFWTEKGGARVIFSRDYLPMWRLQNGRRPERAQPWEWIDKIGEEWFWSDSNTPWRVRATYERELSRLDEMKLPGLPKIAEALPLLVNDERIRNFKDAVRAIRPKEESPQPIRG